MVFGRKLLHGSPVAGPSVDGIAVYRSEVKDDEVFALVPSEIATGTRRKLGGIPQWSPLVRLVTTG